MSDEPLSGRSRALFGLAGAGVIAGAALTVAIAGTPSHEGSTYLTASFSRAGQGLDTKSDVKVRGIAVGQVDSIDLDREGHVIVRFRLDPGMRVPRTAAARIEPVSVFGPKDIVLDLGAGERTGPYLADGGRISRTDDPSELSETSEPAYRLTKAINPDDLATILHTLSEGLEGEGPAMRRIIGNGSRMVDTAYANRLVIEGLINDLTGLSGTLASKGDAMTRTARDFNRLAPALYQRSDKTTRLLAESSELTGKWAQILRRHGADIGKMIDGSAPAVAVFAEQHRNIPINFAGQAKFFALLTDGLYRKGPEGTLVGSQFGGLPLDLCAIAVGLCPVSPEGAAPVRPGTAVRP